MRILVRFVVGNHRCMCLLICFLMMLSLADASQVGRLHDDLTYNFLSALPRSTGDSRIAIPEPTDALLANPAALTSSQRMWGLHVTRMSPMRLFFQKLNSDEQYSDYQRYSREAIGTERLTYVQPLRNLGSLGVDIAFQHEGDFQRVNAEGQQINTFAQTLWAWGIGYGLHLADTLSVGVDMHRVRAKVSADGQSSLGWAYLYNVGAIQSLGQHVTIGLSARNLNNGFSLDIPERAKQVDPQIHLGLELRRLFSDKVRFSAGWIFPAREGMRFGIGADVRYWQWARLHIGYVNDTLRRVAKFESSLTEQTTDVERIWKKQGLSLGVTLEWSDWAVTLAWAPQHYPRADENEKLRIESGTSQIGISLTHH